MSQVGQSAVRFLARWYLICSSRFDPITFNFNRQKYLRISGRTGVILCAYIFFIYFRQVSIQPPSLTSYKNKSGFGRLERKDKKDPVAEAMQDMLQEKLDEEMGKR